MNVHRAEGEGCREELGAAATAAGFTASAH